MVPALMMAAAISTAANPLLGRWIGERPGARIDIALQSSMTITRDAISFGSGRREVGVAPISAFDSDGQTVSVRTRFGEVYRFRFQGADHMCRVVVTDRIATPQCFARSKDRA